MIQAPIAAESAIRGFSALLITSVLLERVHIKIASKTIAI